MYKFALSYVDVPVLKLDFENIADETPPALREELSVIGEAIRDTARVRFITYGRGEKRFLRSAQGMESGAINWRTGALTSVRQTLPRSPLLARRRPAWAEKQLVHGLIPAMNQYTRLAQRAVGGGIIEVMKFNGFR